jgi:Cupin-like domain
MSSPTETFFVWHPDEQKGIQCRCVFLVSSNSHHSHSLGIAAQQFLVVKRRFGERGVVAATHYDSGRNMVAMIKGAKRYILSPPRACSKLGLFTSRNSPIYRHSLLNFAHIPFAKDYHNLMSNEERAWLGRASTAEAIDTVVKAGEVRPIILAIP